MGVFDTLSWLIALLPTWLYTQVFGTKAAPQVSNPFTETTITAPNGIGRATTIGLGATLVELWVPDAHGGERDVVLGYDDRSLYLDDPAHPVFGATVGRVAGRISNGAFTLDGKTYKLAQNDGASCIHGGKLGWDRRAWKRVAHSKSSVTYELVDNAYEGFPGKVTAQATYEILNGPELRMSVKCTTTERTPVVVSNHSYWNLDGHEPTLVKDTHDLRISASRRAEVGGLYVPTGKLLPVSGSPYDFLKPHIIGSRWEELTRDGTTLGYNDNWVYDTPRHENAPTLTLTSTKSGVRMDMFTNQPSVVLYSAIYLDGVTRKGGNGSYVPHSALAIEHQAHADAINKPEFGVNVVLNPGEEFSWWATARFSTVDSLH